MLVLSRHRNEGITIRTPEGREIKVCVVDVRGEKVRIGLTADDDVTLHRDEVQEKIDAEARRVAGRRGS